VPLFGSPDWQDASEMDRWVSALRFAEGCLSATEDELSLFKPNHLGLFVEAKRHEDREYVGSRDQHRLAWDVSWRPHPANRRVSGQQPAGEIA